MIMKRRTLFLLCSLTAPLFAQASQVEVLHWWTSGGEGRAVEVLKSMWAAEGNQWQDFAVQGGGGKSAMTVLKSRALAANPPQAAHLKGFELQEWASLGFLRDLEPMADHFGWNKVMPPVVHQTLSAGGELVAVPTGIHRVNWLWINQKVLRQNGLTPPTDWPAFIKVAQTLKEKGIAPLAIGNDPWQLAILFEAVALGEGGVEFYRKAFLEQDSDTLAGADMVRVLKRFKELRALVPERFIGLGWNQATVRLEKGEAAMQIMGDWVKGDLSAASYHPGDDILCLPTPGSQGIFIYNIDSIAMFKVRDPVQLEAQSELATLIMRPDFQIRFNQAKGSIPALTQVSMQGFDRCAVQSHNDFLQAQRDGHLLPSVAEGMALPTPLQQALLDLLTGFFNDPSANPQQTAERLGRVMRSVKG